jgi:hypothetical protein
MTELSDKAMSDIDKYNKLREEELIIKNKQTRNKFERKLDEYNHTMEFIRTIVPVAILVLQVVILVRLT